MAMTTITTNIELAIKAMTLANAVLLLAIVAYVIYYYRNDDRFKHILPIAISYIVLWTGSAHGFITELFDPVSKKAVWYSTGYLIGDIGLLNLLIWRRRVDREKARSPR